MTNVQDGAAADDPVRFRVDLRVIDAAMDDIMDFPQVPEGASYDGPTLFIGGARARYITEDQKPVLARLFPAHSVKMLDTGHWVHAERPSDFAHTLAAFLA